MQGSLKVPRFVDSFDPYLYNWGPITAGYIRKQLFKEFLYIPKNL
jgi:hypothetical protein